MAESVPPTMTVIEISQPGGPQVLKPVQRPVPQAATGEILIRVSAAGVNRPDLLQRQGNYPPPPGASDIPGLEVAGRIAALGEGVTGFAVGDAVCAQHFRSYDPASGTYLGRDGRRHACP